MCGRYTFTQLPQAEPVADAGVSPDWLRPRYNVAPTNYCPVFPMDNPRQVHLYRWGLVPHWAKDEKIGYRMINARAESVHEKPAFREALAHGRCVVWADGFYEWKKVGKDKQPYRIILQGGTPFVMAGISARWRSPEGQILHSFAILTTTPNELMAPIHDRMPVILDGAAARRWLAADLRAEALPDLLRPYPAEAMQAYPVSPAVGQVRNDSPALIEPWAES
ncbi:MAG: SOS response-associated peptidase [Bacteroidetes bacterium]|nr:MAG: SOS response-associated peptidase [Bacteroidota bacterium]